MSKPLPSFALDMSKDGIALHHLAYDGHWHELARTELTDPALRERLASMRGKAATLQGRRFKTRIWLPPDQIILKSFPLEGSDETARLSAATKEIAASLGGNATDYAVRIGEKNDKGEYAVAALRTQTIQEARSFAKSHGFRARFFSTQAPVRGFPSPPVFQAPVDKTRVAVIGLAAAALAALVIGGSYSFYKIDPLNLWDTPPLAADFAPFQQPDPDKRIAALPPLPPTLPAPEAIAGFTPLTTNTVQYPRPYLPPRQLVAEALETITMPKAPKSAAVPEALASVQNTPVSFPAQPATLIAPAPADSTPSVGWVTLLAKIEDLSPPQADTLPTVPSNDSFSAPQRPVTVANTAFFLEPLPAMATRLSPDALAEFASRSGLSPAQLSRMASPILLIESRLVTPIKGLPPLLPRLRSGAAIPPQVAPPVASPADLPPETATTAPDPADLPASLFALLEGPPDIVPFRRPPAEPVPDTPAEAPPPDTAENNAVANAVDAAINALSPAPADAPFALISGAPPQLPRLRSGTTISPEVFASAAPDPRPRRRPQNIVDLPAPLEDMISGAAPITAARAVHRSASFAAIADRISASVASAATAERPHAVVPAVPVDPPRTVSLPTSVSVARSATIDNAINLRKTNLIGIFGTDDARTALIRLPRGRMVRVQRGQSFSGWTVVAISTDAVRIRKRNREEILRMPAE
ncbi:MAG: hypothetical protein L3J37_02100 [Rhodobacteraceae bacterium]|nr:hypothetical protein [Paracoccaceae bacterium]